MPIILSLSYADDALWAAGPEGLFRLNGGGIEPVPQPQAELACCTAIHERLLVGGLPHGVAFTPNGGESWQAAWMDGVTSSILCLAADPRGAETGVLLAGSAADGVLRSQNRGLSWNVSNFGLHNYAVLALAWAPAAPTDAWPAWEVALAGTESGIFRSPNGGLAWRRSKGIEGAVQAIAVAPDFHRSGLVLAGTEEAGLWRSSDGGRTFHPVEGMTARVDALTANADGWLLSDERSLWRSSDGAAWRQIAGSKPALVLLATPTGTWAGGEDGVEQIA